MGDGNSVKTRGKDILDAIGAGAREAAREISEGVRGIDAKGAVREVSQGFQQLYRSIVEGARELPERLRNVKISDLADGLRNVRFIDVKAFVKEKPFFTLAMAVGIFYLGFLPFQPGTPDAAPVPRVIQRDFIEEPTISVYFHETGAIREMKIEEYLEGVVAGEMNPGWPRDALAAQAIVARTFTWRKIQEGGVPQRGTDASTDIQEFQAYNARAVTDNVKDAVERTRGEILTHEGEPILAWFHASSGGQTATAEEGLEFEGEPTPYIQSVKDLEITEDLEWQRSFTLAEVERAARAAGVNTGTVRSIRVGEKGPSGRAVTLAINDKEVSAPRFRLAIGSEAMRSTFLTSISITGNRVVMRGRGFGHGVGLSQWGAWAMANQGKSPEEITSFYFRNIRIEQFWE